MPSIQPTSKTLPFLCWCAFVLFSFVSLRLASPLPKSPKKLFLLLFCPLPLLRLLTPLFCTNFLLLFFFKVYCLVGVQRLRCPVRFVANVAGAVVVAAAVVLLCWLCCCAGCVVAAVGVSALIFFCPTRCGFSARTIFCPLYTQNVYPLVQN